ncbi:glycoside hydrolase family 2 protein [Coraliomargarita parva]|uniref:glycoside hydrolase family 2 protein n=1 Tax=Coraliomargarita parva TaxID=3014050 RepID=UPI0022B4413A|nr:glycoside hydrolase family 2 TIM barrel-domain containing protein [Coraliomargarita parva]
MSAAQNLGTDSVGYLQLNNRKSRSLNGKWGFFADNMLAFGLKRSRNVFEGLKPEEEDRAIEYDIDAFDPISVPGDWNTQKKEYLLFEGVGWYARRVRLSDAEIKAIESGRRLFLRLDGVNYAADVWWNGQPLGSAELPFLPLSFELSAERLQSDNLLVVRVDARRMEHRIPAERYDWFNYGGLIRSVRLISTPPVFVSQAAYHSTRIRSRQGSQAEVDGTYSCSLNGNADWSGCEIELEIPSLQYRARKPVRKGELNFNLKNLPVELWEPGAPKLYESRLCLYRDGQPVDRIRQEIGFKQVECEGTRLLVNQKPAYLKGVALHEERLGAEGGKPRNLRDVRKLLDLAQETGCNFMRLAHYPYDESWLAECDRRGLLVWDEIPVYWEITYKDPRTESIIRQSAVRMVELSRGHACVLCHALANETWERPGRKRVMGAALRAVKRLDPDIPVTAAFNAPYKDGKYDVESVGHSIYEQMDVIGLNEYGGWYSPPLKELAKANIVVGQKPLFVTEFGAAGPVGVSGPKDKLWNLDSQKAIYKEQIAMFERCEALSGWTPWVLKDFRSTLRANGFQRGWNRKGLVGPKGEKKPVFDLVKRAFRKKRKGR